jgi:hypothetical protein
LSLLDASTFHLTVQKPTEIYTKISITVSNTFLGKIMPFACPNENACGGELRSISPQSFSPVQARHSVLQQLDLDRVAKWSQETWKCLTWFRPELRSLERHTRQRS